MSQSLKLTGWHVSKQKEIKSWNMTEESFANRKAWNGAINDLELSFSCVKAGKTSGSVGQL